jgi:hypothetical protein
MTARGPASKIMRLGLEQLVVDARGNGLDLAEIVKMCNELLRARGEGETVSKSTVKRYLTRLAPGTAAAAHEPTVAGANAAVAIAFAQRLNTLDEKLGRWIEEADQAVTPVTGVLWDPYLQAPVKADLARANAAAMRESLAELAFLAPDALGKVDEWIAPVQVLVVDWHARKAMSSEMRRLLATYTDLMQRVHDAEEVKAFQESVQAAIREASPEVAAAVIVKLRERQSIRKAALLGA